MELPGLLAWLVLLSLVVASDAACGDTVLYSFTTGIEVDLMSTSCSESLQPFALYCDKKDSPVSDIDWILTGGYPGCYLHVEEPSGFRASYWRSRKVGPVSPTQLSVALRSGGGTYIEEGVHDEGYRGDIWFHSPSTGMEALFILHERPPETVWKRYTVDLSASSPDLLRVFGTQDHTDVLAQDDVILYVRAEYGNGVDWSDLDELEYQDGVGCDACSHVACNDNNPCTYDLCDAVSGCYYPDIAGCETCSTSQPCPSRACQRSQCIGGRCEYTADDSNVAACPDRDICLGSRTCVAGSCSFLAPLDCPADNHPCHQEPRCVAGVGCVADDAPEDYPCLDDDLCNGSEVCSGGECMSGVALDCDDGNPCTDDSCSASDGCVSVNNDANSCDNGDACTINDECIDGVCVAGDAVVCTVDNVCLTAACDSDFGCVSAPNTLACDDGDPCTLGDQCQDSVCLSGSRALACDDGNPCTLDTCEAFRGCVFTAQNGTACDDGDLCTVGDTCVSAQCVPGNATLACDDGSICTQDSCDPVLGCQYVAVNDGAACSDDKQCTLTDSMCLAGVCNVTSESALTCDDGNPCTDDTCDEVAGCVFVANTRACDDGNACTLDDACQAGRCMSGPARECDDDNTCTSDTCDPSIGCVFAPLQNQTCDDGNMCTVGDTCIAGVCAAGQSLNCTDADPCTETACDPVIGCVSSPVSAACDDGDACTQGDKCMAGQCEPGPALECDDGIACTSDSCNSTMGCVFEPQHHVCEDGDPCTQDQCSGTAGCLNITDPADVLCMTSPEFCGNGYVDAGEACDGGYECRQDCRNKTAPEELPSLEPVRYSSGLVVSMALVGASPLLVLVLVAWMARRMLAGPAASAAPAAVSGHSKAWSVEDAIVGALVNPMCRGFLVVAVLVLCSITVAVGLSNGFRMTGGFDEAWTPVGAPAKADMALHNELFGVSPLFMEFILTAPDNGNILEGKFLQDASNIITDRISVLATKAGNTWSDLCFSRFGQCISGSVLSLWDVGPVPDRTTPLEEILARVNTGVSQLGQPIDVHPLLGDVVYDEVSGNITSAASARFAFYLRRNHHHNEDNVAPGRSDATRGGRDAAAAAAGDNNDDADDFAPEARSAVVPGEEEQHELQQVFIDDISTLGTTTTNARLVFMTSRSVFDESRPQILLLLVLMMIALLMVFVFFLREKNTLLAVYGLLVTLFGIGVTYCLVGGWMQVPISALTHIFPFLMLSIGIDDMFVLTNAMDTASVVFVDSTYASREYKHAERCRMRLDHALRSSLGAVTMTTLTDILAFGVGAATATLPGVRDTCVYLFVGVIIDFILQTVVFVAGMAKADTFHASNTERLCQVILTDCPNEWHADHTLVAAALSLPPRYIVNPKLVTAEQSDRLRVTLPAKEQVEWLLQRASLTDAETDFIISHGAPGPARIPCQVERVHASRTQRLSRALYSATRCVCGPIDQLGNTALTRFSELLESSAPSAQLARILVIFCFAAVAVAGLAMIPTFPRGLGFQDVLERSSYGYDYLGVMEEDFGHAEVPVEVVIQGNGQRTAQGQGMTIALCDQVGAHWSLDGIGVPGWCWYDSFLAFARSRLPPGARFAGDGNVPEGDQFLMLLRDWMMTPEGLRLQPNVVMEQDSSKTASRLRLYHADADSFRERVEQMESLSELLAQFSGDEYEAFAASELYGMFAQMRALDGDMTMSILVTVIFVFVVSGFFLRSLSLAVLTTVSVAMTISSVFLWMRLAGLPLNAVTMVILILSVGFSVDYSSHLVHALGHTSFAHRDLDSVKSALRHIGLPIVYGGVTTLCGSVFLLFTGSNVMRWAGSVVVICVISALAHSVILLPVMVSAFAGGIIAKRAALVLIDETDSEEELERGKKVDAAGVTLDPVPTVRNMVSGQEMDTARADDGNGVADQHGRVDANGVASVAGGGDDAAAQAATPAADADVVHVAAASPAGEDAAASDAVSVDDVVAFDDVAAVDAAADDVPANDVAPDDVAVDDVPADDVPVDDVPADDVAVDDDITDGDVPVDDVAADEVAVDIHDADDNVVVDCEDDVAATAAADDDYDDDDDDIASVYPSVGDDATPASVETIGTSNDVPDSDFS